MTLPFTTQQFLGVFAAYNQAVWPAQNLLTGLGLFLVVASFLPTRLPPRLVPLGLALLWAWMGVVYHIGFFRRINPLATLFGLVFLAQAILLLFWALRSSPASFRPTHTPRAWVGGLLLVYALVIYPKLATAFGHTYPARPTFGLPCPTTIATLGLLLWATPAPSWWLWGIPLAWSGVGATAAFALGMREDVGLALAGATVLIVQITAWLARRPRTAG